ncbi:MAG: hypothetical protein Q7S74_05220 [Nanoarchaeota archaeon]|nr:hypothetical protein [Nanoarchaeota archaeon]
MEIDPHKKAELEDLVALLESIRGRHTELVTVMIPAGSNIFPVVRQLEAERSTAENIKSKQTRSAVIDSIDMIIRELKNYKQTPPNGLALFAGNISDKEGMQDIKIWAIEPPKPLNVRIYRCDQVFVVDPLKEILDVEEIYGLLVIDRQGATIGVLEGRRIKVLQKLTSGVPGKVRAGGQCLAPDTFVETREGNKKIKDLKIGDKIKALDIEKQKIIYTKCINKWNNNKNECFEFTTNSNKTIICSGDHSLFLYDNYKLLEIPASMILKGTVLINDNQEFEEINRIKKISKDIQLVDIETENKNFFANGVLVHNSSQRYHRVTEGLAKEFYRRVAEEMKRIFFDMPKLKGLLVGGPIPTKEDFLKEGDLVTVLKEKVIAIKDLGYTDEHGLELLVEDSWEDIAQQELIKEKNILNKFFQTLGKDSKMTAYGLERVKLALQRGSVGLLIVSKELPKEEIAELEKMAENIGAEMVVVSSDHQDGEQFFNLTKGVGAVLRFAME